jgi:hypothetical protein
MESYMKKFILAAIFALPIIIHTPAMAASNEPAGILCQSPGVADAGYYFAVAGDRKTASLVEESFAGFNPAMHLNCEAMMALAVEGLTQNTLTCTHSLPGATTVVRVYENHNTGFVRASVRRHIIVPGAQEQELQFGALACQYPVNKN